MIKREDLLEQIANAKRSLSEAEKELQRAIKEIESSPRAQKTTASKVVEDALAKVKASRTNLDRLAQLLEIDAS